MFKFTIFVSLCCVFSQVANGLPQNVAPAPALPDFTTLFTTLQQQTQDAITNLNSKILQVAGVQSNEEFISSIANQTQTFAVQIRGLADNLNKQAQDVIEKNNVKETVQNVATRLTESFNQMTQSNPQVQQITETLQTSLKTVLDQANALLPTLKEQGQQVQEGLRGSVEKLYESTLETAKSVASQVDTALKKNEE